MIAGVLEAKTAKQVLITQPNSGCVPAIRDLFCEEEEIVEDTDIGPGTYQGGKKEAKEIEKKKNNDKKRALMKWDQQILNTSADILSHAKTTRPARRGRVSAAGQHLVDQLPPDVVTTSKNKKTTRKDPPLINYIL